MKYIKSYILFVIMGFAVAGCTIDDLKDDVNDLKDRVTLIEQQVKLLNDNLAVIGYILDPQNKTVSKVETVKENGVAAKYVITLSDNTQLTLTIGKEGTVNEPEITIGDDGKWYINGISRRMPLISMIVLLLSPGTSLSVASMVRLITGVQSFNGMISDSLPCNNRSRLPSASSCSLLIPTAFRPGQSISFTL